MTYLWVAVGSALGGMARFWLAGAMLALTGPRFPWGTLLINVLGSLVIGAASGVMLTPLRASVPADLRIFVMTGLCGGFTTFSAFSLQTLELMQAGQVESAALYAAGSVGACLIATWAGWAAVQF